MLKLNILTAKVGRFADEPVKVPEIVFWEYYLRLLDVRPTGHELSEKELQIMAYILAGDPDKSYFRGQEGKELKRDLRIQGPDLSKMKRILVYKGFIEETGEIRGDALPVRPIRKFQKYVKAAVKQNTLIPINFNLSFVIEEDTIKNEEG
jgi:hypothetical protein